MITAKEARQLLEEKKKLSLQKVAVDENLEKLVNDAVNDLKDSFELEVELDKKNSITEVLDFYEFKYSFDFVGEYRARITIKW